jgi:TonB family protein
MAPNVKDVENSAVPSVPAAPATKPPQEASATRPQPVALEVPVTVNGARTVEGSDKREPFSESTKTVLVFGNGAVIRLASQVAPGQLLFITNEKTKKELVCQVVKSKNYRTVTGYVELEFTEPAIGFWGMRFPVDRVAPSAATSAAPVTPTVSQHPGASALPAAAPTKVVAAPPAPVAVKPPTADVPMKTVGGAPPAAPPKFDKLEPPKPAQPAEVQAASTIAPQVTPAASVPPAKTAAPPPVPIKPKPISAHDAVPLSVALAAESSVRSNTKSASSVITKTEPTPAAENPTTEELKQQTTRLQEQLGSLLFTGKSTTKQSSPEPVKAPKPEIISPEMVQKILYPEQAAAKPPAPTPLLESKPAPTAPKSAPPSMAVEEVKIPAWLAPLARETDASPAEGLLEAGTASVVEPISPSETNQEDALLPDGETASIKVQPIMFGGQLLGASSEESDAPPSGGSKKGLFIGVAAAGILMIGAGTWYAKQPGSAIAGLFASKPAATQTAQTAQNLPAPSSQPAFRTETAAPTGLSATSSNQPAPSKPITPIPAVSPAVNSTPVPAVVKETTSAPRNEPPAEQPKKPVLGNVRLATPNINHSAGSSAASESAPSINAGQTVSPDSLDSIAAPHENGPAAPLPVGGDVQPAKLLKSVPPIYPSTARTQRISGDVKIDALIDASGNVSSMKILSGPTLLHQAAMTALKQWKYEPAKLDGNPTQMHLTVTVQFRLQ